ncbi:type VII secretion protein EccB [Streptomyces pactum]|uniref:Type VII secretion protein EccB n=1 Tax=Streptomyces pactum TaxID=68249 RepID=A0ABS0NQ04_9ACTN|nr:type VII secretion protein EccB [Streptomyces pactum]MBH5337288.1 type VII secretion protein EccB [Streptomyces pactum]
MASRRDELNAYTYAKKRMIAAFLQPTPAGTEEGAPRPLRAVLPGMIVGALILAGFGAWGMFKPKAPEGWDKPATNVIIGSDSTTRYVVLVTNKKAQLHPVLNLASAKLLLDPGKGKVIKVDEKVLDSGDLPHGPTLGIPYAPDRLPAPGEAGKAKRWAVCQQPGGNGGTVQEATFVFAAREADRRTDGQQRLRGGEVLYVESARTKARYLVDAAGTKYLVGGDEWRRHAPAATAGHNDLLLKALVGNRRPQHVTDDWLATLHTGDPVTFPELPAPVGTRAGVPGLTPDEDRVGMVLRTETGAGPQQYVVLPGKVAPVSDFTARLLLGSEASNRLDQAGRPKGVDPGATRSGAVVFQGDRDWPRQAVRQVNAPSGAGARDTVCSVLRDVGPRGATRLSTWAGTAFPATIVEGGSRTYVTPGTGLLYRQVAGDQSESGSLFLVTDTGLRYAVQNNSDSSAGKSKIGSGAQRDGATGPKEGEARIRLGYKDVEPVPVPGRWSQFLSRGPRLDTNSAQQPQGS